MFVTLMTILLNAHGILNYCQCYIVFISQLPLHLLRCTRMHQHLLSDPTISSLTRKLSSRQPTVGLKGKAKPSQKGLQIQFWVMGVLESSCSSSELDPPVYKDVLLPCVTTATGNGCRPKPASRTLAARPGPTPVLQQPSTL